MTEDKGPGLKTSDGVISLDDLDKLMNEMDPGFNESLDSIKKDGSTTDFSGVEALQVDSQVDVGGDEVASVSLKRKIIAKLTAPVLRAKNWYSYWRITLTNRARSFNDDSIQFFKHELPERVRFYKSRIIAAYKWTQGHVLRFVALSRAQKAAGIFTVLFVAAGFYFVVQSLRGHWLPAWSNPIMSSFVPQAEFVRYVRDPKDYIGFFQAFPEIEIPFLLSKIVVNLTPNQNSVKPFGAFEFFLGLDAKETAIEVKDREKEIIDLVQRTVEEFTYDEVIAQVGQVRMKARIRDAINNILNQGQVTKVYINTMVTNR